MKPRGPQSRDLQGAQRRSQTLTHPSVPPRPAATPVGATVPAPPSPSPSTPRKARNRSFPGRTQFGAGSCSKSSATPFLHRRQQPDSGAMPIYSSVMQSYCSSRGFNQPARVLSAPQNAPKAQRIALSVPASASCRPRISSDPRELEGTLKTAPRRLWIPDISFPKATRAQEAIWKRL